MWGNFEIKRMIRPSVKSENSVFLLQLESVSNSNKQQICSAAEHGPRWTKIARKSQIFTELQQRNFLRMPGIGQYF